MAEQNKTHLSEEEIAFFVEERYGQIDKDRVYAHLKSCGRCYTEYKDTVRWRGILETDRRVFESSEELVEMGMGVANRPGIRGGGTERSKASRPFSRGRRLMIAAALVVLSAGVLWVADVNRRGGAPFPPDIVGPILAAAESASSNGWIVIPGSESSFDAALQSFRSGIPAANDSAFSESIKFLQERHNEGNHSRDLLKWLITGFVATGQLEPARIYIGEALDRFPGDEEITLLSAAAAYCEGKLEKSDGLYRDVLENDPNNAVAMLNLAIVLIDRGEFSEARGFLESVLRTHAGTPVARRAQLLLKKA